MNKHVIVFALVMFSLTSLSTLSAPPVSADWLLDRSGTLVQIDGAVLGDDDEVEVERGVEASPEGSDRVKTEAVRESEKKRLEQSRELLKKQTELRLKNQQTNGRKSKLEVRSEDGKFRLKQEVLDENGKVVRKQDVEMEDGETLHVEQEGHDPLKINAVKDGELELRRARLKTNSEFDLQVDEKNEITVTLPNGKVKEIALPDQALEKLINNGIIAPENASPSGDNAYKLIAGKNGDPVYEVEGEVEKKFLGVFKMKFAQKLEVAASASEDGTVEAGDIVEAKTRETSLWRRLLERLAK